MSRNLVICCDGTNNQFGPENTSVVRLVQALDRDPGKQWLYYDPGVGTLPEPGVLTRTGKRISEVLGLMFGAGLGGKVEGAYSFLMDCWEPEDRVFLFGFSRGAYTVRVLAAMLHALGLLPRGSHNLVRYAMRLFKASRKRSETGSSSTASNYWMLLNAFRGTFARGISPGDHLRRFPVHFLGVWDTVSSVGWVRDPTTFPYTKTNPSVMVVRHAVSIDERRWFFRQNLFEQATGQDLKEFWFPGVHSDVGGGYPEDQGGLWREPFQWLVQEAKNQGLLVDESRWKAVWQRTNPPDKPWLELQHESLTGAWWLAEIFPKRQWTTTPARSISWLGLGRCRIIHDKAAIHRSALLRIREKSDYRPRNLSAAFIDKVVGLNEVAETLPYD